MASGLMTYSQFKSSRQNSMNGSSAREKNGAEHPPEEGEFEQVWNVKIRFTTLTNTEDKCVQ